HGQRVLGPLLAEHPAPEAEVVSHALPAPKKSKPEGEYDGQRDHAHVDELQRLPRTGQALIAQLLLALNECRPNAAVMVHQLFTAELEGHATGIVARLG